METTIATEDKKPAFNRKKNFMIFFGVVAALVVLSLLYWIFIGRFSESTDNAYVSAPQLQISSQVEGTVSQVLVAETQAVKPGDLLFQIDTTEAKIASEMADAELIKAIRSVRGFITQAKQRKQEYERAKSDYSRRAGLKGAAAYSPEELLASKTQLQSAEAAYRQALENADGRLNLEEANEHPDVLRAVAAAKRSYVALLRAEVKSPVNAVVARRSAQVGQRVSPGVPLATLVIGDSMWVDANFKEDQLAKMRIGQPAKMEADIYGGKVTYTGKVVGFSPGTGSSLSLLPAQNATGNWVKVVQRLPVRIEIDAQTLKKYPLRVGLTMSVTVDTSNSDGVALQAMQVNEALKTDLYDLQSQAAVEHVDAIIKNSTK